MRKIRNLKKIVITFSIIIAISLVTLAIDSILISCEKNPIFVLKVATARDGGTSIYYGLGYQVIDWHRSGEILVDEERWIRGHYVGHELRIFPFFKDANEKPEGLKFVSNK